MARIRSLPFILLLVLLFAYAQQAAMLHALSHDSAIATQQPDKHLPGAKVCEKCAVFAQFSGAIASPGAHIDLCTVARDFLLQSHSSVAQRFAAAYLSRAPPTLS